MKKHAGFLFLVLILLTVGQAGLYAQETGRSIYVIATDAASAGSAALIKTQLESGFDSLCRFFRFDPSLLRAPLRVRVFGNKEAYDRYVYGHLGETKAGAVYLHYNQSERRELIIHLGSAEEASMVMHQAFVQYLRSFIPHPPSWLLDGLAIYFSSSRFNAEGQIEYAENLLWLEAVKGLGDRRPSPEEIFFADETGSPSDYLSPKDLDDFKISSWALVSFLLNADTNAGWGYTRDLLEVFMILSPEASAAENTQALRKHFALWLDLAAFERDFKNYLDSRITYRELMEEGKSALALGDVRGAEHSFLAARDQYSGNYAPYYYLGLIAYEEKNYETADRFFKKSRARGADEPLINYALGLNAAAAGHAEDAAGYLHLAAGLDPARFRARVEEILRQLWSN